MGKKKGGREEVLKLGPIKREKRSFKTKG